MTDAGIVRLFVDEIDALRAQLAQLEQANATLSGQNTDLGEQLIAADALRAEVEKWKDLVKTFSAGNVALEAENQDYASQITTLEWKLSEATKEIERLERRFREAEAEWVERFEQLEAENERLEESLSAENERLKAAVTEIGAAHIAANVENERLRAALQEVITISYASRLPDRVVEIVTGALSQS